MSFFTLTISFILLLCGVSSADFAFVSLDLTPEYDYVRSGVLRYITQDSSGNIQETSHHLTANGYELDDMIFFFRHNNQKRLFAAMHNGNRAAFAVYDPDDFSAPLVLSEITDADLANFGLRKGPLYRLYEFGNNILIETESYDESESAVYGSVIEVNPETCKIVGAYTANGSLSLAVYKNVIYVVSEEEKGVLMMDRLRHVTGKVSTDIDASRSVPIVITPSGENLYVLINKGIYRVSGDISNLTMTGEEFLNNYAVKVADTGTSDILSRKWIWPDGNGGLYYFILNEDGNEKHEIRHWDGSKNSTVYTSGNNMFYLRYDSVAETMLIGDDNVRSAVYRIAALKKNSAGNFTFAKDFGTTVIDMGSELTVINSSPAHSDDDNDDDDNNGNNSSHSSSGGCNSFFGIIALGAIALTVLRRR